MINFPVSDWMPDAKIPSGPIQDKWSKYKLESKLINPNNKRKYTVLVVGSGLAGASACRTWLQRQMLLLPGQPPPRPLHCGPGRH